MNMQNCFKTFLAAVILSATVQAQATLTTLFNFDPFSTSTNGLNSQGGLTLGADGNFYGALLSGGIYNHGTVFKITTNGVFTRLVSFAGTNGSEPYAALTLGPDGNFYGTTYYGGDSNRYGSVFKVTTNGELTTLALFANTNGARPQAGLAFGNDGNLYGTTIAGGYGYGTVFKMTASGVLTSLFSFSNTNGAYPYAALTLGNDGAFYGVTQAGGYTNSHGGWGTIFRITTNGQFTSLLSFSLTNGAWPQAQMLLGDDGKFYGTTYQGGTNENDAFGHGTIFKVTTNGELTTLVSFDNVYYNADLDGFYTNTTGVSPTAGLIKGNDGKFYGTTLGGGLSGQGTLFSVTMDGALTSLGSFSRTPDGAFPWAGLTLGTDGNFYGTTTVGGDNYYGYGTVFKLSLSSTPPSLGITTIGNQPVVVWVPSDSGYSGNNYGLQTTTNLASGNWVNVTNGIQVTGILITNLTGPAFFRLH